MTSHKTTPVSRPLLDAASAVSGMADYLERLAYIEPSHFTGHDPHSAYARLDRLERAMIELLRAHAILLQTIDGGKDE